MQSSDVVLCHPVRTAIGTFNGTLKDIPATELGAIVVRETLRRAALDPAAHRQRGDGQRHPGRQPHESSAAGGDRRRRSGGRASAHRQSRVRLRRPGDRLGRAGDLARTGRRGHRRRHGEHGPSAVSARRAAAGVPHGQRARSTTACCATGWTTRFPASIPAGTPKISSAQFELTREDAGPLGRTLAAAVRRGAGRGDFDAEIVGVEIKGRKGPSSFASDEANRARTRRSRRSPG